MEGYIYFIEDVNTELIKIGFSIVPLGRIYDIEQQIKSRVITHKIIKGNTKKEAEIHNKFNKYRENGEWFRKNNEIMEYINQQHHSDDIDISYNKTKSYILKFNGRPKEEEYFRLTMNKAIHEIMQEKNQWNVSYIEAILYIFKKYNEYEERESKGNKNGKIGGV